MGEIRLAMFGLAKRFGGTQALVDVSLEARAGEALALLGENGAGKSTLMKVLTGVYRPDAGRMELLGRPFAPRNPHAGRLAGVAMIYQELNLAPDLSALDNIMLGQERHRAGILAGFQQQALVRAAVARLGHPELPLDVPVRRLSVGTQQMVEIARALASDAKVIVFDEPTSSLTRHDVERLFAAIAALKADGIAVVYISHFLEEIRRVCERYVVLRDGRSVGQGFLAETSQSSLVAQMAGRSVDELFPKVPHAAGDVLLSLENISGRQSPQDVTAQVRRGEILGITGLVGAGRTELLRCLMGLDAVRRGAVRVGHFSPRPSPGARVRAGMALVSEDRKAEGLAQIQSIADNLTASRLEPYSRFGWLNLARRRTAVNDWMRRLAIKARAPEQPVGELSGGNQQKVAIARVLHQNADVLLLDEPTRGIDVGTKSEIYRLIGEQAASGKAVIFVSSYFPELLAICDRVGVMVRGRLVETRPAGQWSEHALLACAVGGKEQAE